MVEHLHLELQLNAIPHEIVIVDDGSSDRTWEILQELQSRIPMVSLCRIWGSTDSGARLSTGWTT